MDQDDILINIFLQDILTNLTLNSSTLGTPINIVL